MDIACRIVTAKFNDGASVLLPLAKSLDVTTSMFCRQSLRKKDRLHVQRSKYKSSDHGNKLRKRARRKKKGIEDVDKQKEGPMYAPGGFDCDPEPSKRTKN